MDIIASAADKAREAAVPKSDIIGAVLGSVAYCINTTCVFDLNRGVDRFRRFVPESIDLMELYDCGQEIAYAPQQHKSEVRERIVDLAQCSSTTTIGSRIPISVASSVEIH